MKEIPLGAAEEMTVTTTPEMGTSHVAGAAVYSTPAMVGHLETVCLKAMAPFLEAGETSVGYRIDVTHLRPTMIGQAVTVRGRVREVDGRRVVFDVEAHNETGVKIGEGMHERRVIDMTRFAQRSG